MFRQRRLGGMTTPAFELPMTSNSNSRRYLVPGLFLVAVAASYAIGYLSNSSSEPTAGQSTAANALVTPANPDGTAGFASANRIGGKFADDGSGNGGLTVAQVTGGLPL